MTGQRPRRPVARYLEPRFFEYAHARTVAPRSLIEKCAHRCSSETVFSKCAHRCSPEPCPGRAFARTEVLRTFLFDIEARLCPCKSHQGRFLDSRKLPLGRRCPKDPCGSMFAEVAQGACANRWAQSAVNGLQRLQRGDRGRPSMGKQLIVHKPSDDDTVARFGRRFFGDCSVAAGSFHIRVVPSSTLRCARRDGAAENHFE
jgi:hypothetical protein